MQLMGPLDASISRLLALIPPYNYNYPTLRRAQGRLTFRLNLQHLISLSRHAFLAIVVDQSGLDVPPKRVSVHIYNNHNFFKGITSGHFEPKTLVESFSP